MLALALMLNKIETVLKNVCFLKFNRQSEDGNCLFGGWARMAQPIVGFNVVEVKTILDHFKKKTLTIYSVFVLEISFSLLSLFFFEAHANIK